MSEQQIPTTIKVYQDATRLMHQHGLLDKGWKFDFSNEKTFVGRCYFNEQKIVLSKHFIDNTPYDELLDTILHEIAHALAGPGHGHGAYWQMIAIRVGARPNRCATPDTKLNGSVAKGNYIIQCPVCNYTERRFRLRSAIKTATHCGVRVVVYRVKPEQ